MLQKSRGRQLVAIVPENLCMDILSALVNEVVTICSEKQQNQPYAVDLPASPSVISDTDEEIFSPPKKKSTLILKEKLLTKEDDRKKANVCRKLFDSADEKKMHELIGNMPKNIMVIDEQSIDLHKEHEINPLPESQLDLSFEKFIQYDISSHAVDISEMYVMSPHQTSEYTSSGQTRNEKMIVSDENKEQQEQLLEEIQEKLYKELQEEQQKDLQEELQEEQQEELHDVLLNKPRENLQEEVRASLREDPQEELREETVSQIQPITDPIDAFWERENICDGKKRKPRKSLKDSRKDRINRSNLRNTGQEYITTTGKTIRARSMKELDNCRMKCKERIPDQIRQHFYSYYWTLGHYDERVDYVKDLIEPGKKKSAKIVEEKTRNRVFSNKYFLKFSGDCFPICRGCLSKTLDETSKFLQIVTKKKQIDAGMDNSERKQRGGKKKTSLLQLEEAKKHILSFPAFESHYARSQTKKKFLPSDLNLSTMYKLYTSQCVNKSVCLTTYTHIFRGQNISFKKPKIDTCSTCDALNAKIKVAENENNTTSIIELKNELATHQMLAEKAYKDKDSDKKRAADTTDILVATFDLQQCLPTPFLRSGVAFYKRQLWTYNLTIHVCNENKVYCYMWHEGSGARCGNQIASCVYHFISNFVGGDIKHIIFYSDSCAGQNKNNHMIAMFLTAIKKAPNLQSIEHKFLVPGHTHLECDADHALIEKAKRKTTLDVHVPRDWFQLVRSVSKKKSFQVIEMTHESFQNFSLLLKSEFTVRKTNEKKEKLLFAEVSEFKFDKALFPKVMYKKRELEEGQYKTIDYTKWGRKTYNEEILITPCYTDTLPISEEKMKDLNSLFPYIDKEAQEFYSSLKSDSRIATIDPDLEDRELEL